MGHNDRQDAAKVVGFGVYEVCSKPIDANALALTVQRAFQMYELEQENVRITRSHGADVLDGIIATDNRMLQVCRLVEKAAVTDTTVLLLGESGTGKELLARATHTLSSRKNQRFVAISCAAIPETLLESELYGYEKGAFTGALKQMPGKIETAHGGTLFLDEIGDMPLALQAKLLRFLQERVVERVGGRQEISVDVRVVCATNQNLHDLMRKGRFREDLFYRISEVTVSVPPVRERGGDAIILARAFLEKCAKNRRQRIHGFSRDALEAIQTYPWPGNVRELENKIQGAVILAEGKYITAKDLGLDGGNGTLMLNLRRVREQAERQAVVQALTMDNGNISKAAMLLGVSRPTLYDLLHKHGLR
jgi:two-component system NtrC family response regulator